MAKQEVFYYMWEVVDRTGYVKTRGCDATSEDMLHNAGIGTSCDEVTLEITTKRAIVDTNTLYSTPVGVYSWNSREESWQLQRKVKESAELCDAAYVGLWLVEYPDQVVEIEIEKPCYVIPECRIVINYSGNDVDGYTWGLCGTDNGLYWETDEYDAHTVDEALWAAYVYLRAYHEDDGRIDAESFVNVEVSCTNKQIAYLNKRIGEAIMLALD